jgi:UDP-N-acetylmuramoyl-L-alanyl-D-glutamate--2,6-diaminopimelate ligase
MNTAEQMLNKIELSKLIDGLVATPDPLSPGLSVKVSGVQMDSRQLKRGDLFIACFGQNHDARNYIDDAIAKGVVAVLAHSGEAWQGIQYREGVPVIAVDNLAARISEIAARYYGHPSRSVDVIGITGTNGKTSVSQFVMQLLNASGRRCGVIGTLGVGVPGRITETAHTTPDAVFTQAALAEFRHQGIESVAMEVSSVGLHQHRVAAVEFLTSVYTNLTRDHLDYHGNMANYAENKRKLFCVPSLKSAVVNIDDSYGLSMMDAVGRGAEVLTYSISSSSAQVFTRDLKLDRHGFSAEVCTPFGSGRIACRLFGRFNVSNVLAALTATMDYLSRNGTLDLQALLTCASELKPVKGRMEIVGSSEELTCVVDYAHTPEGLRSALQAIKEHFPGKVWCVFGCGGNRDRGKRPMMGEVAEALAGRLVLTDDNPRNEDGEAIVQHILSGIGNRDAVAVIRDRAAAIDFAIANAQPNEIVLVAGKGHENYQDAGGVRSLFSDVNQARVALQNRIQNGPFKRLDR